MEKQLCWLEELRVLIHEVGDSKNGGKIRIVKKTKFRNKNNSTIHFVRS